MLSQKLYLFVTHPTLYSFSFPNMCMRAHTHTYAHTYTKFQNTKIFSFVHH